MLTMEDQVAEEAKEVEFFRFVKEGRLCVVGRREDTEEEENGKSVSYRCPRR